MTMYRPSNFDKRDRLLRIVEIVAQLALVLTVVFPMHPRTRQGFQVHGRWGYVDAAKGLRVTYSVGYRELLRPMGHGAVLVTDSGRSEQETYLRVFCLTIRESSEHPCTVEMGTNDLVPLDFDLISGRVARILADGLSSRQVPLCRAEGPPRGS